MTPDQQRCANWGCNLPIGSTAKPNPKRSFRLFNLDQCGSSMVDYWFNAAMVMALTRPTRQALHRPFLNARVRRNWVDFGLVLGIS